MTPQGRPARQGADLNPRAGLSPAGARPGTRAVGGRRIAAWLLDWLWILLGLAVLAALAAVLRTWEWGLDRTGWNVVTFAITVLPVTLWLAWREAAPRGASPGKRRLRLRVVDADDGAPVGFARTLVRNVVKVAIPWQLGHTVAFGFATAGPGEAIPPWLIAASVTVYVLMGWFVTALFLRSGRTPYDRLSRTRVVWTGDGLPTAPAS